MKFNIYGRDFKELIDRVSASISKSSIAPVLQCVKIIAHDNKITVQGKDLVNYVTIDAHADVIEDGIVWVELSELKRALSITDMITVSAENNVLDIRSAKKSYEIICHDDYADQEVEFPVLKNHDIMCRLKEDEFINYLSKLDCMRSSNQAVKLMTGFCINLPDKEIAVLDSFRIGVAHIAEGMFCDNRKKMVVDGSVYKMLKSVHGKCKDERFIEFYANNKVALLEGKDWKLYTCLIEGEYYKYKDMMYRNNSDYDYTYSINRKELENVAKEYSKVVNSSGMKPMIIYNNDGNIATGICVPNYRTSDVIHILDNNMGMEHEWWVGFNPRFIADACNVFEDEITVKGKYSSKVPVLYTNDEYDVLILPINIIGNDIDFVKKQVA